MKTTLLLIPVFLFAAFQSVSQQTQSFKEKTFLWYHSKCKCYIDNSGDTLKVHVENKQPVTSFMHYSIRGNDTIKYYKVDTLDKGKGRNLNRRVSTKHFIYGKEKLYGDVKQEKGKIVFYPWPYTAKKLTAKSIENNRSFEDSTLYIKIPQRKVVSVAYRAWHFGALTLPLKVYLASQVQPINNVAFDVNINFMIGKKWGSNKYVYLPNTAEGTTYEKSCSFNLIAGIGKVELDSSNTTPYITGKYTLPTFTSGFSFGIHYKKVGVFIATGIDSPMGPNSSNWNFSQMPWLGFGLGLGIN